jgi:hypothetical protein
MAQANIIFITNDSDDIEHLNSFRREPGIEIENELGIKEVFRVANFVYCKADDNADLFELLVEENKLKDQVNDFMEKIREKAKWDDRAKIILAVHWGNRSRNQTKKIITKINEDDDSNKPPKKNICVSYFGSLSSSYRANDLSAIKDEIIKWSNTDQKNYDEVVELLQIKQKEMKMLLKNKKLRNELNNEISQYKKVLDELRTVTETRN